MNQNNQNIQLTDKGLSSLKKELNELVNLKRPKLVERLAGARADGDLKENSNYHSAREELGFLDGRIEELEYVIKNASIIDDSAITNGVAIGTSVKLKVNEKEVVFHIVGEWEADPMQKKISHASPLGQALVGRKVGEKVDVDAPAGKVVYEVLAID
ncbi:transcription elongation factor GreA [Candidatus Woesebacteria bacterium]|nr:MAG: transcription elongation factor GreA [Candidatus Woesebacteria bacterium]